MENITEKSSDPADLESKLIKTVLKLERIDRNLYRGSHLWKPAGGRAVFGGQVLGQALVAAGNTKPENVHIHSMHCYFVRPGNPDHETILYHVQRSRDGTSFSNRVVNAVQNGDTILNMLVSFHRHEEGPFENQYLMPKVPMPEELLDYDELLRKTLDMDFVSEKRKNYINKILADDIPIQIRPVNPTQYLRRGGQKDPKALLWIRTKGHIGDDNNLHRCVAAYISDWSLLGTALIPYPSFRREMMASLDHSMWFHSHFKADEWMLYESESPRSVGARSLLLGRIWKQDGTLAVSVAQEGVIRGKIVPPNSKL